MRENIGLFRGKSADSGEWIRGGYTFVGDYALIWRKEDRGTNPYLVDPETVGECTGLVDRNGDLIYEGDILAYEDAPVEYGVVKFDEEDAMFDMEVGGIPFVFSDIDTSEYEIIGNIYDNPGLIGSTKKCTLTKNTFIMR